MKNLVILGMVGISVFLTTMVNTCPITLVNDAPVPVQVHTNDEKNAQFMMAPGQKQAFGGHDKHAQFSLIEKNPNMRAESIVELKQHSCSMGKDVVLNTSDLLKGTFDAELFNRDIVKNGTEDSSNPAVMSGK